MTVWIKFRPRKLGQYVEIIKERSTADSITIRFSSSEYIPHIKEVLKEHRLKIISTDNNIIVCKTPRPSDQDIEIAIQKIKVLANTAKNSLSQVKADSNATQYEQLLAGTDTISNIGKNDIIYVF